MLQPITLVFGSCSVEGKRQFMSLAYKGALIRDVAQNYGIDVAMRGGAWKPRTRYVNGDGEHVFDGLGVSGLQVLALASTHYRLPIVSELMSAPDINHFFNYLDPYNNTIQVGARNSQNFPLLAFLGLSPWNVLVKNPQHGVDVEEAQGSLERLTNPSKSPIVIKAYRDMVGIYADVYQPNDDRKIIYCVRGQKWPIEPSSLDTQAHRAYIDHLQRESLQRVGSRNLNNIGAINMLRNNPYFKNYGILFYYDPSHVFGGKNNSLRRAIGEHAIKAITEFGYDGLEIEVHDTSATAITDKDQALVTTFNGIDFSKTNMGKEPKPDEMPLSLVDIVKAVINDRITKEHLQVHPKQWESDQRALDSITWDMKPE